MLRTQGVRHSHFLEQPFECPSCKLRIAWVTGQPGGEVEYLPPPKDIQMTALVCAQCEVVIVRHAPEWKPKLIPASLESQLFPERALKQFNEVRAQVRVAKLAGWKP